MKTRFERTARPQARQAAAVPGAGQEPGASHRGTARDVAQRERIGGVFGAATQRAAEEDELQMKRGDAAQRQVEEEEMLQGRFEPTQRLEDEEEPLQARADAGPATDGNVAAASPGGMPAGLRSGIEALSGMDMSDVQVHTGSSRPAEINALAYTQGNEIHVAPGQEQHLAHEAWHVVQQRQGRVQPTMQIGGVSVNDDAGLEREADVMGAKASQMHHHDTVMAGSSSTHAGAASDPDAGMSSGEAASLQLMSGVLQMGGGSHYWRRQARPNSPTSPWGPWEYCGEYKSHKAANKARQANGWTNGDGWEFKQGDKKNPPGQ